MSILLLGKMFTFGVLGLNNPNFLKVVYIRHVWANVLDK